MKEEKDKSEKREHLLNVAERVFGEMGYEAASTRLLAQEAGVNMAMLNYYFGSKDGLLKAVVSRRINGMKEGFEEIARQDLTNWEKLNQLLQFYISRVARNKYFHKILFREISMVRTSNEVSDFVVENVHYNIDLVQQVVKAGVAAGEFKPVDVEMTVASIFGTIYYLINSRRLASKMLHLDMLDNDVLEKDVKPRLQAYLQDNLKAYLLKDESEK
ncbi:TetR/AcrR family transcriptional regulator [Rufibacter soli]